MNKFFALCIITMIFTSCATHQKHANPRRLSSVPEKIFHVSGKVIQITPYCGGARPTDEMLAEATAPKAFPHKSFHIRKGSVNSIDAPVVLSFTTDEQGSFFLPYRQASM